MGRPDQSKKDLTAPLVFAILSAAFGSSFLFGYNIGVVNAPQTVVGLWIREVKCERLGGINSTTAAEDDLHLWCRRLSGKALDKMFTENSELNLIWSIVASIFCLGGLLGALTTSFFVSRFGRRGTLLINNVSGIIGAALLAFPALAHSHEMLIVGRFVMGLNAGLNSGVPPMYFNEISPAGIRGAVGSVHQLFVTLAIWASQILGLVFILGNGWGWPILFGLSALPCVIQLLTLPFCPESPKYLYLDKGDERGASDALVRLRKRTDIGDEMAEMKLENEQMKKEAKVTIRDLFMNPFLRKITIIAMMLMVMQQLSGINAVMFYSTLIFKNSGLSNDSAVYATIGMGAINVAMTFVSMVLVEKAGRKTLLLVGFGGMCVTTVLLTIFMLVYSAAGPPAGSSEEFIDAFVNPREWAAWASVVCLLAFVIFFATGPGSIPWFLVSELFTQGPRAAATTIAVGVNWLCNLIVALTFPLIVKQIGEYTFIIFAVLLALFVAYTWFQVPETKGKKQAQIQAELRQNL